MFFSFYYFHFFVSCFIFNFFVPFFLFIFHFSFFLKVTSKHRASNLHQTLQITKNPIVQLAHAIRKTFERMVSSAKHPSVNLLRLHHSSHHVSNPPPIIPPPSIGDRWLSAYLTFNLFYPTTSGIFTITHPLLPTFPIQPIQLPQNQPSIQSSNQTTVTQLKKPTNHSTSQPIN